MVWDISCAGRLLLSWLPGQGKEKSYFKKITHDTCNPDYFYGFLGGGRTGQATEMREVSSANQYLPSSLAEARPWAGSWKACGHQRRKVSPLKPSEYSVRRAATDPE